MRAGQFRVTQFLVLTESSKVVIRGITHIHPVGLISCPLGFLVVLYRHRTTTTLRMFLRHMVSLTCGVAAYGVLRQLDLPPMGVYLCDGVNFSAPAGSQIGPPCNWIDLRGLLRQCLHLPDYTQSFGPDSGLNCTLVKTCSPLRLV